MPGVVITIVRVPVEKTPVSHAPLFAVAECEVLSVFVHVTLSPAFTVTLAGWNEKLLIVTAALAASAAVARAPDSARATMATANAAVE